jgi:hypothetical protein
VIYIHLGQFASAACTAPPEVIMIMFLFSFTLARRQFHTGACKLQRPLDFNFPLKNRNEERENERVARALSGNKFSFQSRAPDFWTSSGRELLLFMGSY